MMWLNHTQVTPALKALFAQPMPAGMRCFTVLEGSVSGDILTDEDQTPTWSVVRETAFGTTFFAGTFKAEPLSELINELQKSGDVVIGAYADDPLIALLPTPFQYDGLAIDYTDRPLHQGLDAYLEAPEGCTIYRVDAALFERSVDHEMNVKAFGSAEKALEQLIGFYLMKGDDILCEAMAGPAAQGVREMGVVTYEEHRQRGYAVVTCAHLLREIEQSGLETLWNCDKNNLASNALARKLGYRKEQEYRVIAWFKTE